jgi:hypothetical protein
VCFVQVITASVKWIIFFGVFMRFLFLSVEDLDRSRPGVGARWFALPEALTVIETPIFQRPSARCRHAAAPECPAA